MKYEVFWKNPGYKVRPPLKKDIECDFLVVGGGITGVSTAYFLNKLGAKSVVLIEKNSIASGATGMAAGSIVLRGEADLQELIARFGQKKGYEFWKASHEGLRMMVDIIKKEKIYCDLEVQDTLYGSLDSDPELLVQEYNLERKSEKKNQFLVGEELKEHLNTSMFQYALLSRKHGVSVNPLQFTQNLSKVIEKKGVKVYEKTPLLLLHLKDRIAETAQGNIKFKRIILALDSATRHTKVKKLKSTIIVTKPLTRGQLRSLKLTKKKIVWDSKDIYHYFKVTKDNRILLGYGDKHTRKKHTKINPHKPHLKRIITYWHKLFPNLHTKIDYAWTGCFGVTDTKLPLIEQQGSKIIIAGAASQLLCFMAGKHVAQKLLHTTSSWEKFF